MPEPRLEGQPVRTTSLQARQPTEYQRRRHPGDDLAWTTLRNGMPDPRPFLWRGDGEREAEVQAMVAAARARAAQRIREVDAHLSRGTP